MFQLSVPASSRIFCSGFLPFRVRFNCVRRFFFKEPLAPFRRGLNLIAGGVLSIWNLLRALLPTRRENRTVRGFIGAKLVCPTDLAMAIPRIHNQGIYNHATPEKHATSRQKKLSSAKKLNACAASASICISNFAREEKGRYPAFARFSANEYCRDSAPEQGDDVEAFVPGQGPVAMQPRFARQRRIESDGVERLQRDHRFRDPDAEIE